MKKCFLVALAAVVCICSLSLTSCDTSQSDKENEIKNQVYSYYEEIKQEMHDNNSVDGFTAALYEFCKKEEYKVKKEDGNNLVIEFAPSEGFEKMESNVFVSEYSFTKVKESSQVIAMGLTAFKNAENHGPIRYIISPENGKSSGYTKLDKDFFKGDVVTSLVHWNKTQMFTKSSGITEYKMERDIDYSEPLGNVAYEISIGGINDSEDKSGNRSNGHKNPVTTLSDMLASIRNSRVNIEIASFESEGEPDIYPQAAKTVIVIDKSAQTKVEKRFESTKEKFMDDVKEKDTNATFEYKVVKTPKKVLSYDDSAEVMSLLYTLIDGVFATSEPDYEGDILGISSIYKVNIGEQVNVNLVGRYLTEDVRRDMDMTYKATAQLSDFNLNKKEHNNLWSEDEESEFFESNRLKKSLENNGIKRKYKTMLEYNVLAYVEDYDKKSDKMILGVNIDESMQDVIALIEYLDLTDLKESK